MKKIKYIGFYNHHNETVKRVNALSAVNKMNYVVECLNQLNYNVEIISPSWILRESEIKHVLAKKVNIGRNIYTYAPSFIGKWKLFQYLSIIISNIWLFFYLVLNSKKNENILVYHSLWLSIPLYYAKKLKKFNVVLEIEEIYSEIWKFPKLLTSFEKKIINSSESYIIASDLLKSKLSKTKTKVVLYGSYGLNNVLNKEKFDTDYIHLVYAGGIETVRRGAFFSLDILERLPDNYFLNIVGFGEGKDIDYLNECINLSLLKNRIKFHGELKGEDFFKFLSKCDIGLNPQVTGDYMDTAFPSKILTYLNAGLNVISSKVESIYQSELRSEIFFYENLNELENFEFTKINPLLIENLDRKFKRELSLIISSINNDKVYLK